MFVDPYGVRSSDGLELSLKLYHLGELRLGYQQLMAEAPADTL